MDLVSCVHIETTESFNNGLETFEGNLYITDDSCGKYKYPFEVLDYRDFPLFKYLHKSSASKNYALYKSKADIVFIIDSDCVIEPDFQDKHLDALDTEGCLWDNPLENTGFYPRGFPYSARDKRVVANVGLWTNVLDINGADRSKNEPNKPEITGTRVSTSFVPFSGMNVAVRREAIPALFFLPNIGNFKRHDDIFGGYIFQSIVKKKGDCITYGEPFVKHETFIISEEDAEDELEMNEYQDKFCQVVDTAIAKIKPTTYADMYKQFVRKVKFSGRFKGFNKPIRIWSNLFRG